MAALEPIGSLKGAAADLLRFVDGTHHQERRVVQSITGCPVIIIGAGQVNPNHEEGGLARTSRHLLEHRGCSTRARLRVLSHRGDKLAETLPAKGWQWASGRYLLTFGWRWPPQHWLWPSAGRTSRRRRRRRPQTRPQRAAADNGRAAGDGGRAASNRGSPGADGISFSPRSSSTFWSPRSRSILIRCWSWSCRARRSRSRSSRPTASSASWPSSPSCSRIRTGTRAPSACSTIPMFSPAWTRSSTGPRRSARRS